MLYVVNVDGKNYDLALNSAMQIVGVYHHNTDKPVPAWQQSREHFEAGLNRLLDPVFNKARKP